MIEVLNISKNFEGFTVINQLSFVVNRQEIFGVVGPDGAGKSTLLRILAGVLEPSKGNVLIEGKDVFREGYGIKDKISYMPQRFGLYEDLTVEENLYFFARLFGVSRRDAKERLKRLYQFSNLEPFKNRLAGRLSGGMKQKLGLACALIHNPQLLLLDEPTNGVDPVSRREFWNILYELLKAGTTIVLTTAYLDEAERCSRIALMYKGRFLFSGEADSISETISEKFVRFSVKNPEIAFEILKKDVRYRDIFLNGDFIGFFTPDEERDKKAISSMLKGIPVESWKVEKPDLEDIFIKWIKEIEEKNKTSLSNR